MMTIWAPEIAENNGPIYLAIADALADDIACGKLEARTRLPTHRDLAYRLGVTVGTITRAYAEAERRGLVYGEVGRGTFVRGQVTGDASFFIHGGEPPPDRIDLTLNFAFGPYRTQAIARTLAEFARRPDINRYLGYLPHRGVPEHRLAAAQWLQRMGLELNPEQIIVTAGGQHGMMTVFSALCRPGDVVLCEQLTYAGMKALANHLELRLHGVAIDEHGLVPAAFDAAIRATHARIAYVQPTMQNPTGLMMPEERRREIAQIARQHGVVVVEDDVYGPLTSRRVPPIASIAPDIAIYLTSTSKCMAPGLRIGYLAAPMPLIERLGLPVRATVWMAPPIEAEIARQWMGDGTVDRLIEELRAESLQRQAIASNILGINASGHDGCFLIWLPLPRGWRVGEFVAECGRQGVDISGADSFAVEPLPVPEAVRLCVGAPPTRAQLEKGLQVVRSVLQSAPGRNLSVV
ncbi:MAG: PLP-dependent aminotransferase family protein [Reyranellaceae bacterium]